MWDFWEFIVSGRLPGTAVQITFEHWLYAVGGLVCLAVLRRAVRHYLASHRVELPERPIEAFVKQ